MYHMFNSCLGNLETFFDKLKGKNRLGAGSKMPRWVQALPAKRCPSPQPGEVLNVFQALWETPGLSTQKRWHL